MTRVHHDFETFSELDIFDVGAHKYAAHSSTEVLMMAWAVDHEQPKLWVPAEGEPIPDELNELIVDPTVEWHAFNANFERLIWWEVLQRRIPTHQFHCTMQHAWSVSFAGGLGEVGGQMGLHQDYQKDARGKRLINKFCKPAPRNHKADRYTHDNAPGDWAEFKQYCMQDVISEREVEMLLAAYPIAPQERELWLWDQDVNGRGIPVDISLVDRAVELEATMKVEMRRELNEITGLANGNSRAQLMPWLRAKGYDLPNLQAVTIDHALTTVQDPEVRRALECKKIVGKNSTTKWGAFQAATQDDGYVRGMFQFGGAQRTQRWAGRIVQLHNLKSPTIEHPDVVADALYEDASTISLLFGDILTVLSDTIRCAITAPEGYLFTPCDSGSIESRWLGYMSGCERINSTFRSGKDTYKDFATAFYNIAYELVTKAQRKFSKPPVLGCGYQLGWEGLIEYAAGYGVNMAPEDAMLAVDTWREMYAEVPPMWRWLVDACKECTDSGQVFEGYTVRIRRDDNFLFIDLPSGRSLYYYKPQVRMEIPPWERKRIDGGEILEQDAKRIPTMTYMGRVKNTKAWARITTHGGKIVENIDQACCRDILAGHMLEIERALGPVIRGHVHDECIPMVLEGQAEGQLKTIEQIMRIPPPWAPTLLLDAKGFITKRYQKE